MNVQPRLDKDDKQVMRGGKPSWRLRWETRDPGTGERRFVYETFHGTKRESERYWQRRWAKIEEEGAMFKQPSRRPLGDYLRDWLGTEAARLKPTTVAT